MLTAAAEGRISYDRLVALLSSNPRRIYGLAAQKDTWIEVDLNASYFFPDHILYTKCGWSPFSGFQIKGQIRKVVLRGKEVATEGIVHEF
jgi:dihydroorotase-like cyclic amidohydrolase